MYSYTINDLTDGERLCCICEVFKTPGALRNNMKKNGLWKHGHVFVMSIIDHIDKRKMTFKCDGNSNLWYPEKVKTELDNKEVCFLIN